MVFDFFKKKEKPPPAPVAPPPPPPPPEPVEEKPPPFTDRDAQTEPPRVVDSAVGVDPLEFRPTMPELELLLARWERFLADTDVAMAATELLKKEIDAERQRHTTLLEQCDKKAEFAKGALGEVEAVRVALQESQTAMTEQRRAWLAERDRLRGLIQAEHQEVVAQCTMLVGQRRGNENLAQQLARHVAKSQKGEQRIARLTAEGKELRQQLAELQETGEKLDKEREGIDATAEEAQKRNTTLREDFATTIARTEAAREAHKNSTTAAEADEKEAERLRVLIAERQAQLSNVHSEYLAAAPQLAQLEKEHRTLSTDWAERQEHLLPDSSEQLAMPVEDVDKLILRIQKKVTALEKAKPLKLLCELCLKKPKAMRVLPCKHAATCTTCSSGLKKCPLCQTKVQSLEALPLQKGASLFD
eukprot:TRINITY_DN14855_c0_g1_i1.p1 TRINITY_DN14855_c0_g1~~TRINITY_DN14855_c0_g1_i1.p1  ORF type:complete len:425 (+),score=107.87 TRINITY_DN14855_c0_g1_i1:25-1275(+)